MTDHDPAVGIRLQPLGADALVRDHLPELVDAAHDLCAAARGVLAFASPGDDIVVVHRTRLQALEDSAGRLLELVPATPRPTTADVQREAA